MKSWVSKALALMTTVAEIATVQPVAHKNSVDELTQQIEKLTEQVRLQNSVGHRIMLALVVGAATALGASVIATLIILLLRPVLTLLGLSAILPES